MSIVLRHVSKRFAETLVVSETSLEIRDGELFVLLGASGSGKSTLLRLIAGLVIPDSGQILLHGKDVTFAPPQQRGTGFVFQSYSIFRHMTVAENVAFGLRIRKVPRNQRRKTTTELLELVGLSGLGERYADQLSGGQRQRVALARALAYRPEVLLLDEPFGALDVNIRSQLRESLRDIQRQLGVTTVLVTHDQSEAFEMADRIGVIDQGHLLEVGVPQDLYHTPRNEFVAGFLGGGNVVVGRVAGEKIQLGEVSLPLPREMPSHDQGAPVRLLFRPESVKVSPISSDEPGPGAMLGPGRVVRQAFTGSLQRVRIEMEQLKGARSVAPPPQYGQSLVQIEALLPHDFESHQAIRVGDRVSVSLTRFHVLDPTGLKVLIHSEDSSAGQASTTFGLRLSRAVNGPTTLLAISKHAEAVQETLRRLEAGLRARIDVPGPWVRAKVRHGNPATEVLLEAQEGSFELVVVGQEAEQEPAVGADLRRLLEKVEIPVVLVQEPWDRLERILICTAAGEPGKSDVLFGGRIARRSGARATLLHVHSADSEESSRQRAERHLAQGQSMLQGLGVACDVKVVVGQAVPRILEEAERGDYDLIVVGAPAPQSLKQLVWKDLATPILYGTSRPVLVVPMSE